MKTISKYSIQYNPMYFQHLSNGSAFCVHGNQYTAGTKLEFECSDDYALIHRSQWNNNLSEHGKITNYLGMEKDGTDSRPIKWL
tara:strand:- start:340 stop:591 length:252 start_codon:yes stop_codon:yes gene_type:complete